MQQNTAPDKLTPKEYQGAQIVGDYISNFNPSLRFTVRTAFGGHYDMFGRRVELDTLTPVDAVNPTLEQPKPCTYIVRFWMKGIGYGRQEHHAADVLGAAQTTIDLLSRDFPHGQVVVIGVVRK